MKITWIFFTIQHIFWRTSQNLVSHAVVTTVDKEVAESNFTAYCIQQILHTTNVSTTAFYWTSSSARYLLLSSYLETGFCKQAFFSGELLKMLYKVSNRGKQRKERNIDIVCFNIFLIGNWVELQFVFMYFSHPFSCPRSVKLDCSVVCLIFFLHNLM